MVKRGIQEDYLSSLLLERNEDIQAIEKYAEENNVPIMEQTGMQLLLQVLQLHRPKSILEIGTAIGYSAIRMAEVTLAQIVTVERDEERIKIAESNINKKGMNDRIKIIKGDALEVEPEVSQYGPYDVLFIDAAKGQYERFFHLYEPLVSIGGVIISDNVLFKGLVSGESDIPSKRLEGMVKKLRSYNEERMADKRFSSMIYPVGDGVMVSIKKA
ncbi:putative O-methyltransferase YrrM [Evansella vedderi]|uniref:tRNA 5-hydroxyuridine methyltransferase n=1 Tax=Evansella vedderi TaxID=38282 RepID=A0ABT9ZSS4_9BACI|nr:O-methyltransferase [Evansella vedderi]MDQ0254286.1 putative O-methyltransferase YrrM [Evansella vedderi]